MSKLISESNEKVFKAIFMNNSIDVKLKAEIELAYIQEDNDRINRILLRNLGVNSDNKDKFCRNVDKFISKI